MGLDNGFVAKGINRSEIPSFIKFPWIDVYKNSDKVEVVYWRKCWGLREAVLRVLHAEPDRYKFTVDAEDIPAILREIYPFFDKIFWENEGDSIWTFEEAMNNFLIQTVINLSWLQSYMEAHPEVTCEFYDSY